MLALPVILVLAYNMCGRRHNSLSLFGKKSATRKLKRKKKRKTKYAKEKKTTETHFGDNNHTKKKRWEQGGEQKKKSRTLAFIIVFVLPSLTRLKRITAVSFLTFYVFVCK